jgi:hypothetical protein
LGDTGLGGVASSSNGPLLRLSLAPKGATQLHHAQLRLAPRYRRENANPPVSPGTSPPHLRISDADRTRRGIIRVGDPDHRTCKCTTSLRVRQWRGLGTWKTASPSPIPRVDRSRCIVAVRVYINLKSCPQKEVYELENEVKRPVSHGGKQETYHLSDLKHDPREVRVCRTQAWRLGGLGLIVAPSAPLEKLY